MSIWGNPVMLGGSGGGGGGITILSGSADPTAAQGSNGSVYLKYGYTKVLLQPLVTAESELNVIVTANSYWSGYDPWKAFTSNSAWIGNGGDPHWLQIEFPSFTDLSELDFSSVDGARSHAISRIGCSNDGTNFTDLVLAESTMIGNVGHAEISNPVPSKYYRLYFDGSYGVSYYPCIGSLLMYASGSGIIDSGYAKVNGVWQNLIGTDINDIDLGS